MKSSALSAELQEVFRNIGRILLDGEARYFWFGGLGVSADADPEQLEAQDFIKQSLVGIRTGDLEAYVAELEAVSLGSKEEMEQLGIYREKPHIPRIGRALSIFWGENKRRNVFAESLYREIKRRHGESDEGGAPLPAGYSLRISGVSE